MARQSFGDRLRHFAENDHRLRSMGMACRGLFYALASLIHDRGELGVFRFGYFVGSMQELAFMLNVPETELETQITQLCDRRLIERPSAAEFSLPLELMPTRREISARINGMKGGRPRKTPPVAGQQEILLPIKGGGAGAAEKTHGNPNANRTADGATTTSLGSQESSEVSSGPPDFWVLGEKLADILGFDGARGMHTFGIVQDWLRIGATEAMLVEIAEKRVRPGLKVTSLKYIDAAVREAVQAARPKYPPGEAAVRARYMEDLNAWSDRMDRNPCPDVSTMPKLEDYLAEVRRAG